MADLSIALWVLRTTTGVSFFFGNPELELTGNCRIASRGRQRPDIFRDRASGPRANSPRPSELDGILGYANGLGSVEAIATHFASGRPTLGVVNKPMQLGSVVRSSTTAKPAERRLISLAPCSNFGSSHLNTRRRAATLG